MKKASFLFAVLIFGFIFLPFTSLNAQLVDLQWHTFMGGSGQEMGNAIVRGGSGNLYVTGNSNISWGTPINAHSGTNDIFVAKLDNSGNLLWNTFHGGSNTDYSQGIALDSSENIYIIGYSYDTWGSPVNTYTGSTDIFVACLNSSGTLLWNTFMGSSSSESGFDIALNGSGTVFVTGFGHATWGTPVNAFSGAPEIIVAALNSSGSLLWNTFLGATNYDVGYGIEVSGSGNLLVTGRAAATWGSPVNAHSGSEDMFLACLNSSGTLLWNTFHGTTDYDTGYAVVQDDAGYIYVAGFSYSSWGTPLNGHSGGYDAFVAKLNGSGNLLWNTFMGSSSTDYGKRIALDGSGNIYVAGDCENTWDSSAVVRVSNYYAFTACLSTTGSQLWSIFMGTSNSDNGNGIDLDQLGNAFVTGQSNTSWGSPLNPHSGSNEAFVAKLNTNPLADITANGLDGPISITESDTLQIRLSLNRFGSEENVDYWLAYKGPSGWVHYNNTTKQWESGLGVTHQGPLMDLRNKKVFQSKLSPGNYTFYFGVDMVMDGKVNKGSLYKDEVQVTVTSN